MFKNQDCYASSPWKNLCFGSFNISQMQHWKRRTDWLKTGCYGWGLLRKNKQTVIQRLSKKNTALVQHSFLMLQVILLRIQLLSHRQLAKRNVHKDFPIGNIHKSDDNNCYYLHSTSYLLQKCHQVSYYALFLIICLQLLSLSKVDCGPGAGLLMPPHHLWSLFTATTLQQSEVKLRFEIDSLKPDCALLSISPCCLHLEMMTFFRIIGYSVACLLPQSSLVSDLRLNDIFYNHFFTPKIY